MIEKISIAFGFFHVLIVMYVINIIVSRLLVSIFGISNDKGQHVDIFKRRIMFFANLNLKTGLIYLCTFTLLDIIFYKWLFN